MMELPQGLSEHPVHDALAVTTEVSLANAAPSRHANVGVHAESYIHAEGEPTSMRLGL